MSGKISPKERMAIERVKMREQDAQARAKNFKEVNQGWEECAAVQEAQALACALERSRVADGKFPDTLDALAPRFIAKLPHDIITGEPLKYRREGDGYVLYSVGWNEKDDGGKPGTKSPPATEDGDWVWQSSVKTP